VLKTFDPHSGASLKYKTSKAAEVSRLVQMLGTLGRSMAALPAEETVGAVQDEVMGDAPAEGAGEGAGTPAAAAAAVQQVPVQQQQQGKGKKKKGKR